MRDVVVHDKVDVELFGKVPIDVFEELQKFLVQVSGFALGQDLARSDLKRYEQRRGPVGRPMAIDSSFVPSAALHPDILFQRFLHHTKQTLGPLPDNEEALLVAQSSPDGVIDQPAADAYMRKSACADCEVRKPQGVVTALSGVYARQPSMSQNCFDHLLCGTRRL